MQSKKLFWVAAALILTASLASCNIGRSAGPTQDVSSIFTQAAGTMIAQFNDQMTQTALAAPSTPTNTPPVAATFTALPTFPVAGITPFGVGGTAFVFNTPVGGTPIATVGGGPAASTAVGCNDAAFLAETFPDKSVLARGRLFIKTFQMGNTGTCTWGAGYQFAFQSGDRLTANNVDITKFDKATAPGHSNSYNILMKAPLTPGEYIGYWKMQTPAGVVFGQRVRVWIIVH